MLIYASVLRLMGFLSAGVFLCSSDVRTEPTLPSGSSTADSQVVRRILVPHGVIATPEPSWLATVLHLPFFRCPREYIPMVADLNQCLAAAALHQP
jgi:hypothetical protein